MDRLARDKHSSLLQSLVNYGLKKFDNICTRTNVIELFFNIFSVLGLFTEEAFPRKGYSPNALSRGFHRMPFNGPFHRTVYTRNPLFAMNCHLYGVSPNALIRGLSPNA
jgi:hypothetical protein